MPASVVMIVIVYWSHDFLMIFYIRLSFWAMRRAWLAPKVFSNAGLISKKEPFNYISIILTKFKVVAIY